MQITTRPARTTEGEDLRARQRWGLTLPTPPSGQNPFFRRLRGLLPTGRSLPDEAWRRRHRALLWVLCLHAPVIVLFALSRGFGPFHSLFEGSVIAAIASLAALATVRGRSRKLCSGLVSLGLLTSSAVIVHVSGGFIEAHFHFFVMLSLLLLYEDWFPFLLAFAYVVLHHGVAGTLDAASVYNHPGAWANPWKWAAIHGLLVSSAGAANIIAWRLNEEVRARSAEAYRQARESEERFRSAFENAPIGMGLQTTSGTWLQVNRALCDIIGYSPEALLGLDSKELTHPDDIDADLDAARRLLAGDVSTCRTERRYLHANGHVIWCLVSASLVLGEAGRPLHFITQVEDITERKRAEQYLEAQRAAASVLAGGGSEEDVFQKLVEAVGGAMGWELGIVWSRSDDPDALRIEHVWRAPSTRATSFEAASRRMAFRQGIGLPGRVWAGGEPTWIEDVTKDPNFPRAAAARTAGLRGAIALPVFSAGEVTSVLEFFSSERYRPDRELIGTLGAMGRQIGQFVERRRAEHEADRIKDEFVALVSHELRTPLTSIIGYLEILSDEEGGPLTDEQKRFLNIACRNSERLLRLVGDLLFVAQVEAGKLVLQLEDVDLASLVVECGEAAKPLAEEKGIALNVTTEAVPRLVGDRARLAQLLDNLLSNALKFTADGGRVDVKLARSSDRLVLEVSDSGIGIPVKEQARLFQRFFRASSATQHAIPGTGLGLAITKAIADGHGAHISVASAEGEGTTFRVEFPLEARRDEPSVPSELLDSSGPKDKSIAGAPARSAEP